MHWGAGASRRHRGKRQRRFEALESRQMMSGSSPAASLSAASVPPYGPMALETSAQITAAPAASTGVVAPAPAAALVSAASSGGSLAETILTSLVEWGLTTEMNPAALLNRTNFDQAFQAMSSDVLLKVLLDRGNIVGYTSLTTLKSAIAARGIDLSILRPDGVLTAISTANGGTFLSDSAVNVKLALASFWAGSDENRYQVLSKYPTRDIIELYDDALSTNSTDAAYRFYAHSTRNLGPGQATPGNPSYLDNMVVSFGANTTGSGAGLVLPSAQEAVNAVRNMPAGHRTMHTSNLMTLEGYGPWSNNFLSGFIDPKLPSGQNANYFFLWMDQWETAVRTRFQNFFSQFAALANTQLVQTGIIANLDQALDSFALFVETKAQSYQSLRQERRVDLNSTPQYTFWQELVGDPSVGLAAHPNWAALKTKLLAAGLTNSDLSLETLPTWDLNNDDPRIAIWNAVLEGERAGYLDRAVYQPIRQYFPNADFSNYGNFHHSRTLPIGEFSRFTESSQGIGTVVGTHQSIPIYGEDRVVKTPDPAYGTLSPTPPPDDRIWLIQFVPTFSGSAIVGGNAVVTTQRQLSGLKIGDSITVTNRSGNWIDFDYTGTFPITSIAQITYQGSPVTRLTYSVTTDHMLPTADLTLRLGSVNTAYVEMYRGYLALQNDLQYIRTMTGTSSVPITPWITSPTYRDFVYGQNFSHWQESIFHAALSGAEYFNFWRLTDQGSDAAGNTLVSNVLDRLDAMVGYANRKPLSAGDFPEFSEQLVVSGMEAGGRRVWRMTPNPATPFTIQQLTIAGQPAVMYQIAGQPAVTLSNATLIDPALDPVYTASSPLGYWVVQNGVQSDYVVGTLNNALSTYNNQATLNLLRVSTPPAIVRGMPAEFTLTPAGPAYTGSTNFNFAIDWTGDGITDQTVSGPAGTQVTYTFNSEQSFNLRVTATPVGGGTAVTTTRAIQVQEYALVADMNVPGQVNLLYGGTTGVDTLIPVQISPTSVLMLVGVPGTPGARIVGPIKGVNGRVIVYGGGGDDFITGQFTGTTPVEAYGGDGNDQLFGNLAASSLYGGNGNDLLVGGAGAESLDGGTGQDTIQGNDGNDTLVGGGSNTLLDGGAGNDRLTFTTGFGVMVGGTGNDTLVSAAGRDVLIGGAGQDVIDGSHNSEDLLITGSTTHDGNYVALGGIYSEWNSSRTQAQRIANLSGTGTGPRNNGNYFLVPGTTVLDDAAVDQVLATTGLDWVLSGVGDDVGNGLLARFVWWLNQQKK